MPNRADHPWKKPLTPSPKARPNLRLHPENLVDRGEVPVETLQRAVKRSGLSKSEVARRLGWYKRVPNLHRLNIVLGLEPNGATRKKQKRVTYETALRLCRALDGDPFEFGV